MFLFTIYKFLRAQERPATLILTLTSGLCITRARQVYNRDTESGSWNFVVPLRTIRMRKMCQSQHFVTWAWDTGCRLLSHGRSKRRSKRLSKLLLLSCSRKCVSSLELEVGTYINSFESSMKWPFVKSLITQNEPNKNLFTNPDFEGMTL